MNDPDEEMLNEAVNETLGWQGKLGLSRDELRALRPFLDYLNTAVITGAPLLLPDVGGRRIYLVRAALAITLHEFEVVNRRMDEQENK